MATARAPDPRRTDQPSGHHSIEAGLRAYDGALLVVSHDETFLHAIGISRRLELSSNS
jgi:ATPase subunit of ABC transporter with duplicated ATPase domains